MAKVSKKELFLELAKPNKNGVSRWVKVTEFVGKYQELSLGNGCDFGRKSSKLAQEYIVEFDKTITKGNRIDAVRVNGFNKQETFKQTINKEIRDYYKNAKCVMLGINGKSENTIIEIDHKDGRKNSSRVSNTKTQKIEDFQPLCKAANDIKRHICKECKKNNIRWDAKNLKGNPYSFYKGTKQYTEALGCVGCYQYDPVAYRKECVKKISGEVTKDIMRKLYPEDYI